MCEPCLRESSVSVHYEDISASAKERIYAAAEREGDASDGEARREAAMRYAREGP